MVELPDPGMNGSEVIVARSPGDPEMVFAGPKTGDQESLADGFDGDLVYSCQGVSAFSYQSAVGCGDKDA
jgi:hypothetical protein